MVRLCSPLAQTGWVIADRYRLQARIDRGATGVVWRARDELLEREVAVKEVQVADTFTETEQAHAATNTLSKSAGVRSR